MSSRALQIGQKEVRTDPGRKRHHNEDSYVFQPPLFAIADGMGGARAGEVASALAADALNEAGGDSGGEHIVVQLIQAAMSFRRFDCSHVRARSYSSYKRSRRRNSCEW